MANNKLSQHDRFTRSAMSNPKVAEEFFQQNLPEHIKKVIDFSSLRLQKDSFIDDKLKLQIADVLYSVNFNGKPGFLYILFEHASTPQPLLPFRMLKYITAIMDQHLNKMKANELPLVYPLILYNGQKPYPYSMDLFALFPQEERELAKETLTSPYHLVDLTQVSDEELQKFIWFGTMALALKHIQDPDILPFLQDIIVSVKELEKYGEESYIYSIVTYIAEAGNIPHQDDWAKTIQKLEEQGQEKAMKLIRLVEQVIVHRNPFLAQKIIEIGIEQGIEKGRQEEKIEIAKAMLLKGIDPELIANITELSKEDIKGSFPSRLVL